MRAGIYRPVHEPLLDDWINANADGCRRHVFQSRLVVGCLATMAAAKTS